MTNLDLATEALWPNRFRVLDRDLQPLCIGHALLLHRFGSPLATQKESVETQITPGDLILAILICSRSFLAAQRLCIDEHDQLPRRMKLLGWWMCLRTPGPTWLLNLITFREYLAQGWRTPRIMPRADTTSEDEAGSPGIVILIALLMHYFGRSIEEALSTPISAAYWMVAANAEALGKLKVRGEKWDDIIEMAKTAAKEHAEKLAAVAQPR